MMIMCLKFIMLLVQRSNMSKKVALIIVLNVFFFCSPISFENCFYFLYVYKRNSRIQGVIFCFYNSSANKTRDLSTPDVQTLGSFLNCDPLCAHFSNLLVINFFILPDITTYVQDMYVIYLDMYRYIKVKSKCDRNLLLAKINYNRSWQACTLI